MDMWLMNKMVAIDFTNDDDYNHGPQLEAKASSNQSNEKDERNGRRCSSYSFAHLVLLMY